MRSITFEYFEILDNVRLSNIYEYMLFLKHLNNLLSFSCMVTNLCMTRLLVPTQDINYMQTIDFPRDNNAQTLNSTIFL